MYLWKTNIAWTNKIGESYEDKLKKWKNKTQFTKVGGSRPRDRGFGWRHKRMSFIKPEM